MEVIKHIKDLLEEENKQIETIKTGYTTIDNMILGMRRRELVLFASTPGVGKTAMLLNLALNMAKSKTPVLFITYETTARKISEKLLGILAGGAVKKSVSCALIIVESLLKNSIEEMFNFGQWRYCFTPSTSV